MVGVCQAPTISAHLEETVEIRFIGSQKSPDSKKVVKVDRWGLERISIGSLRKLDAGNRGVRETFAKGTAHILVKSKNVAGFQNRSLMIRSYAVAKASSGPITVAARNGLRSSFEGDIYSKVCDGTTFIRLPIGATEYSTSISPEAYVSSVHEYDGVNQAGLVISATVVDRGAFLQIDQGPNYRLGDRLRMQLNDRDFDRGYGRNIFGQYVCDFTMKGSTAGTWGYLHEKGFVVGGGNAYSATSRNTASLEDMQKLFSRDHHSRSFRWKARDINGEETTDAVVRLQPPIKDSGTVWRATISGSGDSPEVIGFLGIEYKSHALTLKNYSSKKEMMPLPDIEFKFMVGMQSDFGGAAKEVAFLEYKPFENKTMRMSESTKMSLEVPARSEAKLTVSPSFTIKFPRILHYGANGYLGTTHETYIQHDGWQVVHHSTSPL